MANNDTTEVDLLIKEESDENESNLNVQLKWKDYVLILDIILLNYFSQLTIAVPLSFFSRVVLSRNQSLTVSSVILQSSPAAAACVGVPLGRYLHLLGAKRTIIFGVLFEACSNIAFGFINTFSSNTAFVVVGTLLRIFAGVGNSCVYTSSLALAVNHFPHHCNFVLGLIEGSAGLAYLTGAIIGALLYNIHHSMVLPFLVVCVCYLLSVIRFAFWYKPHKEFNCVNDKEIWGTLQNVRILLMLFILAAASGVVAYFEVSLTVFMERIHWTILNVACLNLGCSFMYIVTAALYGILVDKYPRLIPVTFVLGLIALGSVETSTVFATNIWKSYLIFSFFGIAVAVVTVGTYSDSILHAEAMFPNYDKTVIQSSLAGLWATFTFIGRFVFPIVASLIEKSTKSIEMTYVGFGIFFYLLAILALVAFLLLR